MKRTATVEEYRAAIADAGGLEKLSVLSSYTYCDGSEHFGPGRHIFTEWGTKVGGDFVAEHEEHDGAHTYRVAGLHKSEEQQEKKI